MSEGGKLQGNLHHGMVGVWVEPPKKPSRNSGAGGPYHAMVGRGMVVLAIGRGRWWVMPAYKDQKWANNGQWRQY